MALTRAQKEALVQGYSERLGRSQVLIWARYQNLTVELGEALRKRLRDANAEAVIVKNTLMRLALEQAELPVIEDMTTGPQIITFVYDDIAPAAKALFDFVGENREVLEIKTGIVGDALADAAQIRSLVDLPSRDMLIAMAVGGIRAPLAGLVNTLSAANPVKGLYNVLSGTLNGLVNVLEAHRKNLEEAQA